MNAYLQTGNQTVATLTEHLPQLSHNFKQPESRDEK